MYGEQNREQCKAHKACTSVCVDVERNESQEAHKPKTIPTSVLPSSEGVDGYNILVHSLCRLWCPRLRFSDAELDNDKLLRKRSLERCRGSRRITAT